MKKTILIILTVVLLAFLLAACTGQEEMSVSQKTKTAKTSEAASQNGQKEENSAADSEQWPWEEKENTPYLIRQDFMFVWNRNPEAQEFTILSKDGLSAQHTQGKLPEWNQMIGYDSANYSLDGSTHFFLSYLDGQTRPQYTISSMQAGTFSVLTRDCPAYEEYATEFSWDGSAMVTARKENDRFSLWLYRDGKAKCIQTEMTRYHFYAVFSPDSRSLMYTTYDAEGRAVCRVLLPNGEVWEAAPDTSCYGIALSNDGEWIYLIDEYGFLAVQQKNDVTTRRSLGNCKGYYMGYYLTEFSRGIVSVHKEALLVSTRFGWVQAFVFGLFFNINANQMVFCEVDEDNNLTTCYLEEGQEKQLLFEGLAVPLMPDSIAIKGIGTATVSAITMKGGRACAPGLHRLNKIVWTVTDSTKQGGLCDLCWVDEDWNTEMLAEDVDSNSLHISEDGMTVHYMKDKKFYCLDLSKQDRKPILLTERMGTDDEGNPLFWTSYDGENTLWFDSEGNAYTVDRRGKEKSVRINEKIDFYAVRPAGDAGFLFVTEGGKLYYTEAGTGEEISGLKGRFSDQNMVDYEGVFIRLRSEDDQAEYSYITTDGKKFRLIETKKKGE